MILLRKMANLQYTESTSQNKMQSPPSHLECV